MLVEGDEHGVFQQGSDPGLLGFIQGNPEGLHPVHLPGKGDGLVVRSRLQVGEGTVSGVLLRQRHGESPLQRVPGERLTLPRMARISALEKAVPKSLGIRNPGAGLAQGAMRPGGNGWMMDPEKRSPGGPRGDPEHPESRNPTRTGRPLRKSLSRLRS